MSPSTAVRCSPPSPRPPRSPATAAELRGWARSLQTSLIVDMDPDESTALLIELIGRAAVVEYQYRVGWEPDQLVFWDNRIVQHYAASDYFPDVRVMERASIVGHRPV